MVSVYTSLGYNNAVSDVDFHPKDNIVAFCSFGDCHPTQIYYYDAKGEWQSSKIFETSGNHRDLQ